MLKSFKDEQQHYREGQLGSTRERAEQSCGDLHTERCTVERSVVVVNQLQSTAREHDDRCPMATGGKWEDSVVLYGGWAANGVLTLTTVVWYCYRECEADTLQQRLRKYCHYRCTAAKYGRRPEISYGHLTLLSTVSVLVCLSHRICVSPHTSLSHLSSSFPTLLSRPSRTTPISTSVMSRSGRNTYDSFNEPLGSSGYRRSEDDSYNSYSAQHGPGSGLSGFYANNKKRIFICLAVSVAVIVLIAIIAAVASKKDSDDGPSPPGPDDDWTTIGNLPAYRVGTDPRVLLYLPDVRGRRQEAINHVTKFGANGFTTYLLDYFDGGQYNSSNPNHAPVVAAQRVREAVAVLRQQDHITSIQVTGYCYGGGVAVLLADGTGEIDSAVAAHTAFGYASPAEQTAFINNIAIPTFFIMVHTTTHSPHNSSTHVNRLPAILTTDTRLHTSPVFVFIATGRQKLQHTRTRLPRRHYRQQSRSCV